MASQRPQASSAPMMGPKDVAKFLQRGYQAMMKRDFVEAGNCCKLVLKYHPKLKEAHFLVGLVAIERADWPMARHAFKNVVEIDPTHAAGWAQLARCHMSLGQFDAAERALSQATKLNITDPLVMDVIGNVYSLLGEQNTALEWFDMAREASGSAYFDLSRAKALIFLGNVDEAREALASVLAAKPDAAMAHWMLSRLETVTSPSHALEMQSLLSTMDKMHPDAPFLSYALGKEWEDLEEWDKAFEAYDKGAKAKRAQVVFDEDAEIALFDALETHLDANWLSSVAGGHDTSSPIFIVGQPRTGTTLVERIITAHSDVASAGELQQFSMAIKRVTGMSSPKPMTADIIAKAASVDVAAIGEAYMQMTQAVRPDAPRFIDKLPVNYMYLPLIAAALPNAKIIHIVRNPADSCFSSFKQLFADAYFHSYDQEEMARHHVRYRRLMEQWRALLGDRVIDVVYEDVVADLEPNAKKIIDFLELDWQDACVNFHEQKAAVTTASATQVREKAHSRSVGKWKQFENYLGPMLRVLENAGLK